jgi:hypothetical protein
MDAQVDTNEPRGVSSAITEASQEKIQPWKSFLPVPNYEKPTEENDKEVRIQKEKDFHDSS